MSFIAELRRRNVFRVGMAYAVVCWLLLQISDILIERIGAPDWVFPTLLMVLGIGFPLALLFAWAFEMTPEGLKRESEVDRSTSITPQTGRRLDRAIIVVLGLALAYFALDKFVLGPEAPVTTAQTEREATSQRDTDEAPTAVSSAEGTTTDRGPSIAVLPFVNMSAEADNEYFSDGLSEELLNLLARIEGLSVAARTSSFKFKGSDADIAEIGGRLNVGMVLEGSVRKAGDQVRITAQLIKVDDGFHLWSDTYDRQLDNIFDVQDEIATAIVESLRLPLLGEDLATAEEMQTESIEAYDLYLLGMFQYREMTGEGYERAIEYFEQALELDPDYVRALAALAGSYLYAADFGDRDMLESLPIAEALIDRALALDPGSAEALYAKSAALGYNGRNVEAAEAMEQVLRANPNHVGAMANLARLLGFTQPLRARQLARDAYALDPLSDMARGQVISTAYTTEGRDAAYAEFERLDALEPDNPALHEQIAFVERWAGRIDRSIHHFEREWALRPGDTFPAFQLVRNYLMLGDDESAERWANRALERAPDTTWTMRSFAELLFFRGEYESLLGLMGPSEGAGYLGNPGATAFVANILVLQERLEEAESLYREALGLLRVNPQEPPTLAEIQQVLPLASLLDPGPERDRLLARGHALADILREAPRHGWSLSALEAQLAALEGDREGLFTALNACIDQGYVGAHGLTSDPVFRDWQDDPQFLEILGRLNQIAQEQLAEIDGGQRTGAPT